MDYMRTLGFLGSKTKAKVGEVWSKCPPWPAAVTWDDLGTIEYGTRFAELKTAQITQGNQVASALEYDHDDDDLLEPDEHTLEVVCPATILYTEARTTTTVTVTKAPTTIQWDPPSEIDWGTPFEDLMTAHITKGDQGDDTLDYGHAEDDLLEPGDYTLTVTAAENDHHFKGSLQKRVKVRKAPTEIDWDPPAEIEWGATFDTLKTARITKGDQGDGALDYGHEDEAVLEVGSHDLTVTVKASDHHQEGTITKTVTVKKARTIIKWPAPSSIRHGTPLSQTQLCATLERASDGTQVAGTPTYAPPAGTVLGGGNKPLTVSFVPQDTKHFEAPEDGRAQIAVTPVKPRIAGDVTLEYGYPLSLDAVSVTFQNRPVQGNLTGKLPKNTYPDPGEVSVPVTFNPTDKASFLETDGIVKFTIKKKKLVIVWDDPAPIPYGTKITGDQLDYRLDDEMRAGQFKCTYVDGRDRNKQKQAGGAKLPGGTHQLTATFELNPKVRARYEAPDAKTVSITVTQVLPVIRTNPPAQVKQGPLADTDINASAHFEGEEVDGAFGYAPALGTHLQPGQRQVSLTFTPTDQATFLTTATATVTLNVVRVTNSELDNMGIPQPRRDKILKGKIKKDGSTLDGAHSPSILNNPDYQTSNPTTNSNGTRSVTVCKKKGNGWSNPKSSTLPPQGWNDDMMWEATEDTLQNGARTYNAVSDRYEYTKQVNDPTNNGRTIPWKVVRQSDDHTVVASYPLSS